MVAFAASPASAAVIRPYQSQLTEAGGSPFGIPQGLALDSTGNLYVADSSHAALDKFDSSGAPVTAWGNSGQVFGTCPAPGSCSAGEVIPFTEPNGLAVDGSDNLWATDRQGALEGAVDKFDPSGGFILQSSAEARLSGQARSVAFSTVLERLFVADSEFDDLWVLNGDGSFNADFTGPWGSGCCFISTAADNSAGTTGGDVYVTGEGNAVYRIDGETGAAAEFSEAAPYIEGAKLTGTPAGPFNSLQRRGIAVDSEGNLYVADSILNQAQTENLGIVYEFAPSGKFLGKLTGTPTGPGGSLVPFGTIPAIAVRAASGKLYVADETHGVVDVFGSPVAIPDTTTDPASALSTTSATLNGEVNPAGLAVTECFFEYGESTAYGATAPCVPEAGAIPADEEFHPVHADLTGLNPGASYHFRLVAGNANGTNGESADQGFFTGTSIESTSVSAVTATSATLETELNSHGQPTTYRFEYDMAPYLQGETGHGTSTPDGNAGSGLTGVARSAHVQGLQAATTYHYRVVAESPLGTVEGPERTFTTQPIATFALPDERGWELVSPAASSATIGGIGEQTLIQAAASGEAIAYLATSPTESPPEGYGDVVQVLSARGSSGWNSRDLAPPHQSAVGTGVGQGHEYYFFSEDLSLGLLQPFGAFEPDLSSEATEQTPFLRSDFLAGQAPQFCTTSCYRPLITAANVPGGAHFGAQSGIPNVLCPPLLICGPLFLSATPDLGHIVLDSKIALTSSAGDEGGLYEVTPATPGPEALQLISVLPGGEPAPPSADPKLGYLNQDARNAVSAGGSRFVWSTREGGESHLYLRDTVSKETVQLDAIQGGSGEGPAAPQFQIAAADGSRVFFTDGQRLTEDSGASGQNNDLFECQIVVQAGELSCQLTDLTPANGSEPAHVLGSLPGAGEDGSYVYFVANGALAAGANPGDCSREFSFFVGTCNLYLRHQGATTFIAALSGAEGTDWAQEEQNLNRLTTRVSPNGRWLAFMSQRPLTGYDNRDAVSGRSDQEVFLYHAPANSGEEGSLVCASCDPTGARPHGVEYESLNGGPAGGQGVWPGSTWLAANVPGWTPYKLGAALYQSRYLSDSGRLFFNSSDALVPADANGTEDVYQYEPPQGPGGPAADSCTPTGPSYSPRSQGCVDLISSGTSAEESGFLDASQAGTDAFFLTAAQLSRRDIGSSSDVYDARTGGSEAEPPEAVECVGDACQQPATPPSHPTPGTALLNGPGNVLECPKDKVKKSGKCAARRHKKAHKKHGKKSHKRTTGHKRGGGK